MIKLLVIHEHRFGATPYCIGLPDSRANEDIDYDEIAAAINSPFPTEDAPVELEREEESLHLYFLDEVAEDVIELKEKP